MRNGDSRVCDVNLSADPADEVLLVVFCCHRRAFFLPRHLLQTTDDQQREQAKTGSKSCRNIAIVENYH